MGKVLQKWQPNWLSSLLLKSAPNFYTYPLHHHFLILSPTLSSHQRRGLALHFKIHVNLGGDGETKKGDKKKFITREQEPQQYWQTAGEMEGENPMKTPIPYIIIFGISTPFVIY